VTVNKILPRENKILKQNTSLEHQLDLNSKEISPLHVSPQLLKKFFMSFFQHVILEWMGDPLGKVTNLNHFEGK